MCASPPTEPSVADPAERLSKTRTERIGTALAWLVPPLFLAAAILALVPIQNGRVQDCGTPLAFVATGRADAPLPDVDRAGQKDEPPKNFTERQYRRAAKEPCSDRAGTRMGWAAGLAAMALVAAVCGLLATLFGRYWLDRNQWSDERRSAPFPSGENQHQGDENSDHYSADHDQYNG